jgi:hypothetical protein
LFLYILLISKKSIHAKDDKLNQQKFKYLN